MQAYSSQHSKGFAEFLRQMGVSLVVSTYQAGQLVLIRPHEKGANTHFMPMRKPMGIAVEGGLRLAIGESNRIEFFRNVSAVAPKLDGPQHDAAYLHRARHVTGEIDIHEMGYDEDMRLWFINTRMSCLCTLAPDYSVVPEWKPPFITRYDTFDRCHLNGLAFRDGRPRYVSMLGSTDEPGGWRKNKTGGGRIMDITDDSIVLDGLCMPHSPRWYRDQLWFLSSGEGSLNRVEADGSVSRIVELPGFTRGLDFHGDYAIVGLSQVRETAVFAGLPLTARVADRQCGVYVIDIDAGTVVGILHFKGEVREIFDVKILPHRFPTVLDTDSAFLNSAYDLPESAFKLVAPRDPIQDSLAEATRAQASGNREHAIEILREVYAAHPEHRHVGLQLALTLQDGGRWQESMSLLKTLVARDPDNAEAWNFLGICHVHVLDFASAFESFDHALGIDRQFAKAHFNRGLLLLKLQQFAEAWSEYEWRWQTPQFTPLRCAQPQWQGEVIREKRLLVHGEQSERDQILFWRFLGQARSRCKELIYIGPAQLAELVAEVDGVDESRAAGDLPGDRFDVHVPLMSLPLRLGLGPQELAMADPYVRVPAHVEVRRLPGQRKTGFVWQADPDKAGVDHAGIRLTDLTPLFNLPGNQCFSLQRGISGAELELLRTHGVENLEPELTSYSRAAAFIEQLDLLISADSTLAHLAAAMGKPVWLLLADQANWHWGLQGESSFWYPSARLFRKVYRESWAEVVAHVRYRLAQY